MNENIFKLFKNMKELIIDEKSVSGHDIATKSYYISIYICCSQYKNNLTVIFKGCDQSANIETECGDSWISEGLK